MNIYISLALLCFLCSTSTGFLFGPKKARDCKWAHWTGTKCEKISHNTYRIRRRRTKLPAKHGGRDCVGPSHELKYCNEAKFVAATYVATVSHRSRGGGTSNKRTGKTSPFAKGRNPCTTPHYDAQGGLRMMGKPCETQTRRRRNAEGLIETYEKALKENIARVKRQIVSTYHRDILFLVDESGSVGKTHYEMELKLVNTLISKFCGTIAVAKNQTRVAVMSFDWTTHVHLNFDKYFQRHQIMDHVDDRGKVPYTYATGNRTCLIKALEYARTDMITTRMGARNDEAGTERVVLLITDGCANCENQGQLPSMLGQMRTKFEALDIPFITFFIGKRSSCVKIMAGLADGSRCYQVFRSDGWDEFDEMINYIAQDECMDAWEIGPSCP